MHVALVCTFTLLFHNLDHGWKIGFRNESAKRRSFRKVETDYYIPIYRRVAKSRDDRPNACRRSHSTRPPRRKRSRSTASRHATKPNAAANRHYPRNNQRPGGGGRRQTPQREGERQFSLLLRAAFPTFLFFFFFFFPHCYFSPFLRSRSKVARLSLVYLIIAIFSSPHHILPYDFLLKKILLSNEKFHHAPRLTRSFFFFLI